MRLSSLLAPAAADFPSLVQLWSIVAFFSSSAHGFNFNPAPSPNLDLSNLGRVGLAGDFDSISLYQYEQQSESGFSTNGSQSIIAQFPNGAFASLASTDASIATMCSFVLKDNTFAGVVVGGNFTSLGGLETQGIALFNPNNSQVTALPGLTGRVAALLCDKNTSTVYVGGDFKGANSTNAIAWVGGTGWANLPFAGFNGPVKSIARAANGNIIFGGSFDGLGNTTSPQKKDQQVINISAATISAGSSTNTAGFNDPRNIVCKTTGQDGPGNTWLLADNEPGFWRADFKFGFRPTKLRIWNTHQDGRGTKTFRYTAFPINGIMNFTFTDPDTNQNATCDARCPLSSNPDVPFQDFHFVNVIGMSAFKIDISDWYGSGGGLTGVELFQDDIYAFAVNDFNEPTCVNLKFSSVATTTGPWVVTPSQDTDSGYLKATFNDPSVSNVNSVVFMPDIKQSGNYSVTIYTPGCLQDNDCESRGKVNITGTMASATRSIPPLQTEIYQTNNFNKYDPIYNGYVDASSDSFRPSVTLTPSLGQDGTLNVVAQKVRFELVSSTGGLNGLYEFDPNIAEPQSDFSKSAIDRAGVSLEASALVHNVAVQSGTTFVAGTFTSSNISNIFAIDNDTPVSLPGGGLNAPVKAMFLNGTFLYVGGNFTDTKEGGTKGLNNIAAYITDKQTWQPLGAGVNGRVNFIVPITLNLTTNKPELVIAVTGDFDQVLEFGANRSSTVQGLAIWVPSRSNWLQNLKIQSPSISGQLTASLDLPNGDSILAGTLASGGLSASGAVSLSTGNQLGLNQLPVTIQAKKNVQSSKTKRDITTQNVTGVVTGFFYEAGGRNFTILGGHFTAEGSNGSNIENLLFINGASNDAVTGIGSSISSDSTFLALAVQNDVLYAGGSVSGTASNNVTVNGLVAYDLVKSTFAAQPPALVGQDVVVNAISTRPNTGDVYVAGRFDSAGSLSCPSVCVYSTTALQWNRPGFGLSGTVEALAWAGNSKLVAGGDLTVNGTNMSVVTYDATTQAWTPFQGASGIPGPVTALAAADKQATQFWVAGASTNGSAFLMKYNGTGWVSLGDSFGKTTRIRGLQMLSLSKAHAKSSLLPQNQALLVTGQLNLPNFGNASAALFDGTTFTPFILSTTGGESGSLSRIFSQKANFFSPNGHHLALGWVILISLGISLVLVFLIVVIGVYVNQHRIKSEGYMLAPTENYAPDVMQQRVPPQFLFSSIGQAGSRGPRI